MSVTDGDPIKSLKVITDAVWTWLRQLLIYHRGELRTLLKQLIGIVLGVGVLTLAWQVGWQQRGMTWHVMYTLEAMIEGPPGPVFVAPLGFLFGLVSIFFFDAYKRLQGLLILSAGLLTMVGIALFFDRLRLAMTPLSLGVGLLMFLFGLLWGGMIESRFSSGKSEMRQGFQRLMIVVAVFGLVGIFEATVDYRSPIIHAPNASSIVAGLEIPAAFPGFAFYGPGETFLTSPVAAISYLAALGGLLWTLSLFTEYEMEKKVLLLGPDRAGKTWLMSGAGFCLYDRAVTDHTFEDPNINSALNPYVEVFRDENFDDNLLDPNALAEFNFFSFTYEHGVLPKRRLEVNTVDYAGEHLQDISIPDDLGGGYDDPWEWFNDRWADKEGVSSDNAPDFDTLTSLDNQGEIDADDIPPLLSVLIDDYDTVALILPGDEFGDDLDDDELPTHIDSQDIDTQVGRRQTARHNGRRTGYFQIYKRLLSEYSGTDFFFLVTMSDIFLETYRQDDEHDHKDPKGNPNWDAFKDHVYGRIENKSERGQSRVDFMSEPFAHQPKHYYPVYFEPDPQDYRTNGGVFKPKLDWDDDYYPLRGLKHLLKRMGR